MRHPVVLRDDHGDVAFYGLPYLEPALVKDVFKAERAGHEAVLTAAMDRVRADLATRPDSTRSVVLAHAFVAGGAPSDSERDITVGGVAAVPSGVFDGVDYTALGHLHGSQVVTDRVRYSGSPLAYSFSEVDHRKTMWLIDLDATGAIDAERIDFPVPRPLARLRGRLDMLLDDPALARHEGRGWRPPSPTPSVRTSRWPVSWRVSRTPSASSSNPSGPPRTRSPRTHSASRGATTSRSRRTSWRMSGAGTGRTTGSVRCCAAPSTTYGWTTAYAR